MFIANVHEVFLETDFPAAPLAAQLADTPTITDETPKDKVKLTFAKSASLKDPTGPFHAGLEDKTRRAVDLHEGDGIGDGIDENPLQPLAREAAAPQEDYPPTKASLPESTNLQI